MKTRMTRNHNNPQPNNLKSRTTKSGRISTPPPTEPIKWSLDLTGISLRQSMRVALTERLITMTMIMTKEDCSTRMRKTARAKACKNDEYHDGGISDDDRRTTSCETEHERRE